MDERKRIYFCACDDTEQKHSEIGQSLSTDSIDLWRALANQCQPEFTWYEPQDLAKGKRIAELLGYPEGIFCPYKICSSCRRMGCRSYYTERALVIQSQRNP